MQNADGHSRLRLTSRAMATSAVEKSFALIGMTLRLMRDTVHQTQSMTLLPEKSTALLAFREGTSNATQPLRVGVVLNHPHLSPWVDALVSFLRQLPGIDVRVLTLTGRPLSALKRPAWLTERLYSASRAKFDPFGNIAADVTESPLLESVDRIRSAGCGILVWLADGTYPNLDLSNMASHGVCTVRLGKQNRILPFWDEVANNEVTSTVTIYWHESSLLRGRAVRTAETTTSPGLYLTLNAEEPLVATIRMLAGLCLGIHGGGRHFQDRLRSLPEGPIEALTQGHYPTSLEAGQFVLRKLARSARLRWNARGKEAKWFVAIRPNTGTSITDPARLDLAGFRELSLPKGTEAADPFPWETGGRHYLFFEDLATGSSRGRIGCVELLENGSCSEMTIILERDYSLSYPCVVPADGELFLLPESSEAGRVDLYRFSRFPEEVELVASPVEGLALVDTTPFFLDAHWYFFTTTVQPFMETLLFWSDRLGGAWNLHPCSPISSSARNSRSAGNLLWRNGRLYRPTQDCSVSYGYAVQVNEIIRLTPTEFEERSVNWIPPVWSPRLLGTHTWNESNRLQVLDGLRWQRTGL